MAAAAKRNGNGSVQLEATLASSYETGKTKVAAEETTRMGKIVTHADMNS